MAIATRKDSKGQTRYRAVVTVRDEERGGRWPAYGSWHRLRENARRDELELYSRREAGQLETTRGMTVDSYLTTEWLPGITHVSAKGRPLGPRTAEKYANSIARLRPLIGDIPLTKLKSGHVERARDELAKRMAPATVTDIIATLSRALDLAEVRGYIVRNPASHRLVRRLRSEPRRHPEVDPKLAGRILRAAQGGDPWDAAVHLALMLSLRREEILALRWSDVDLETGAVEISRAVTETGKGLTIGRPKSEASARRLIAPPMVIAALRRHKVAQAERRLQAAEWTDQDLIVDRGDGKPYLPSSFSKWWRMWASSHGFTLRFHDLRAGTASLMVAAGIHDAVAVDVMGHGSRKMLMHYQTITDDMLRDAAGRLEELFRGPAT
jgi:integrase